MARTIVHTGRRFQVAIDEIERDGVKIQREVVVHPGAVVILPLLADGHVVMIKNYRATVGQTLWEVPAGTLEPPERPEVAAVRELAEETGYRAAKWRKLCEFYPSPGILTERMHLFVAEELTEGKMALEAGEQIEKHLVEWKQAVAWAKDGTIQDAKTLVAILLYDAMLAGGQ